MNKISQAMQEALILISTDRFIKEYDNVKVYVAKKPRFKKLNFKA